MQHPKNLLSRLWIRSSSSRGWALIITVLMTPVSCSKDRSRMLPPQNPLTESVSEKAEGPQSPQTNRPSSAILESPRSSYAATMNDEPVFSKDTCNLIFTKAQIVMNDHAIYQSFNDLDEPWNQRMCQNWVMGFDSYGLYWTEKESQQLISQCAQMIHLDFKNRSCEELHTIPAAWLNKRNQFTRQLNRIIVNGFQLTSSRHQDTYSELVSRAQQAKKNDLWLMEALGYPHLDHLNSRLLADSYTSIVSNHAYYNERDLADLTIRAFIGALDTHSSYAMGKYDSSHADISQRIINLTTPNHLIQLGDQWFFTDSDMSQYISSDTDTADHQNSQSLSIAAGDQLIGIYDSTNQSIQNSQNSSHSYLPAPFLDQRHAHLFGRTMEIEVQKNNEGNGQSDEIFRINLSSFHESGDDQLELHATINTFMDITKNKEAKIATLKIDHFHSHDQGLSQYTHLAKQLLRLKSRQVDGLVLDLRGNHLGAIPDTQKAVSLFLSKQQRSDSENHLLYVSQKNRFYPVVTGYHSPLNSDFHWSTPVTILVDHQTGGAAEFLSHTLQRYANALIVGGSNTEGYGSEQTYVGPDEQWDGYLITTRIFKLRDNSTWNCWGLGVDISWQLATSSPWTHSSSSCGSSTDQFESQNSPRDKTQLSKLAHHAHQRHNLDSTLNHKNLQDNDLMRAAMIATDDFFINRHSSRISGRYQLTKAIALGDLHEANSTDTLLYPVEENDDSDDQTVSSLSPRTPSQSSSQTQVNNPNLFSGLSGVQAGHAQDLQIPAYSLVIDENISFQVCKTDSQDLQNQPSDCVSAFVDSSGQPYQLPDHFYTDYGLDHAESDADNFLQQIHIHDEERRLFYKSFGMGIIGGSFTGVSSASMTVLGGITGVAIFDSTMDATAGVPGHVDEQLGVPRVAFITSAGTATGSVVGVAAVIATARAMASGASQSQAKLAVQAASKLPLIRKIIGGAIALTGLYVAFFSDANSIAKNPWHPFYWFAHHIWDDPSLELAESWPKLIQGQPLHVLSAGQMMEALKTLKPILVDRDFATDHQLSLACLPQQSCRPI